MFEFLKLAPELGNLLNKGMEFYKTSLDLGEPATVDAVALFIERASGSWNPVVSGQTFLDDPGTRRAGARFLAGIAVRVAGKGRK
jgi:hypothetical protein